MYLLENNYEDSYDPYERSPYWKEDYEYYMNDPSYDEMRADPGFYFESYEDYLNGMNNPEFVKYLAKGEQPEDYETRDDMYASDKFITPGIETGDTDE